MKHFSKHLFLLGTLGLMFLAVIVRAIGLNDLRLTHDEMSLGYNAYSLVKTGVDEWGVSWPLVFKAFGDQKLPGYVYADVVSVAILGLSVVSIKLPSLLAGVFLVGLMALVVREISKNERLGLLAGLMMAISPWAIHLSRMGLESNLALFWFVLGLFAWLKAQSKQSNWQKWAILSGIAWSLSLYTYVAFRLILVLWWVGMIILGWIYKTDKRKLLTVLSVFLITLLPLAPQLLSTAGKARFSQVSMFQDEGIVAQINERRSYCYLIEPKILPKVCNLLFHKPQAYAEAFAHNYLAFLLPEFLFMRGDELKYLQDPGFGEFSMVFLPFYVLGVVGWLKKKNFVSQLMTWGWLIAPIPSALVQGPQIVRGSALLPFVVFFIVMGMSDAMQLLTNMVVKRIFVVGVSLVSIFLVANFLVHYWFIYPRQFDGNFFPMSRQAARRILDLSSQYDQIYISDDFADVHILLAFEGKWDPSWYRQQIVRPGADGLGFWHPTSLDKYHFASRQGQKLVCDLTVTKTLYVTGPTEDVLATEVFKGFSGVHTQVKLVDVEKTRAELQKQELWDKYCPKLIEPAK